MPNYGGRHKEVVSFFRGLPLVDATENLVVVVKRADVAKGKRLDPNACALNVACKRLFGSHAVLINRRTAYVELADPKTGIRKVHRYRLSGSTAEAIATFDKKGIMPEGGFVFLAPTASQTLGAHREYSKKYAREVYYGKRTPKRNAPNKSYLKTMYGVRDGRGKLGINYAF